MFRVRELKFHPLATEQKPEIRKEEHDTLDCENQKKDLILGDIPAGGQATTRARHEESVWNIDGELIEQPNLHIKQVFSI